MKGTGRVFEPGVWILGSYTDGDDVTLGAELSLKLVNFRFGHFKVDLRVVTRSGRVELADMLDAMERKGHGNPELSGGRVDPRNHLRGRTVDLEMRLEEVEGILRVAAEI